MYSKDLHGNILGSPGYRAELTSRRSIKPTPRQNNPPQYAKIKEDTRSHNCAECEKLHYEIERLQMQLEEESSKGSRLALLGSKQSTRSVDYRNNADWNASWAATPDLLSTHSKGNNPRQRKQVKELEEDVKRLKRELNQKSVEVRLLREKQNSKNTDANGLSGDLDALVDPLPPEKVAEMYIDIFKQDWQTANQALLKDKVSQNQSVKKLIKILTAAFAYCDKVAPQHLEAILDSTIKVKSQGTQEIPHMPTEKVEIHNEAGLFRKCIAEKVALNIIKNFRFEVFMRMGDFTPQQKYNSNITQFVDKCVHITWYMAVQNYPIILDDSVSSGKEFDFEHYDLFQDEKESEEATYDYLVWPALINAQNNTFLSKGVAEALKSN